MIKTLYDTRLILFPGTAYSLFLITLLTKCMTVIDHSLKNKLRDYSFIEEVIITRDKLRIE